MKPSDFYTKPACNNAQRLSLTLPDGIDSGEWLDVYGIDSDVFEAEIAENNRRILSLDVATSMHKARAVESISNEDAFYKSIEAQQRLFAERQELLSVRELENKAALVAGWSFDEPCTKEAVMEFLRNCPLVGQELDRFTSERMNFLKKK